MTDLVAMATGSGDIGFMLILTWLPAVILPLSTIIQLWRIHKAADVRGVSITSWILFAIANIGAYALACDQGGAADPRSILAFLLSAVLDVWIVAVLIKKRRGPPAAAPTDSD